MQYIYVGMLYIPILDMQSSGNYKALLVPAHSWHSGGKTKSERAGQCTGHGGNPLKW